MGVKLPTFAATLHQILSELIKLAEPGLIGREMANFQQLPGAAEFSSDSFAGLPLWARTKTACKALELNQEYNVDLWAQCKTEVLATSGL